MNSKNRRLDFRLLSRQRKGVTHKQRHATNVRYQHGSKRQQAVVIANTLGCCYETVERWQAKGNLEYRIFRYLREKQLGMNVTRKPRK